VVNIAKLFSHLLLCLAIAGCARSASTAKTEPAKPPAATDKPAPEATQKPATATQKPAPNTQKPAGAQGAANATPAAPAAAAAPKPLIATSADGTKIAYEVTGTGPALLLAHGGGQTRRSWNQLGYVDRLSKRFTVITFDQRGIGDSDKPTMPASYALDRVLGDFIAVADAAKAQRFHVWGFGHGATIARYLAARSDRVISAVLVGTTMGPTVTGVFKEAISGMKTKWQPVIDAQAAGKLDVSKLPPGDRAAWEGGMAVTVLTLTALMEFPPLEPAEIKAPTLWAMGADDSAMENVKQYEGKLAGTNVTLKVLQSVNYSDSFIKMEQVMSEVEPFLIKNAAMS
jgi:pimeloyl-ACP methyl ester carboxylesterase